MNHERHAWIQLALTPYIGAESFLNLIHHFGNAQSVLNASFLEIKDKVYRHHQLAEIWHNPELQIQARDQALEWEQKTGGRILLLSDEDYPFILGEGLSPPPLLFVRGNIKLLHQPAVAIVGSRHATPQAIRIAHDFGMELSKNGIPIVSGMAAGIDTAAHQGALKGMGSTIAIWGTGIDRIYPQSNKKLAYEIAEQGIIVSEFPLGTRPIAGNFPRRNRLIAAQSRATLVVEAALESGSLITARLASEMGREVMAIPGSIDNPHSKGCHQLIKDGAKLVDCVQDILIECPQLGGYFEIQKKQKIELNKQLVKLSTAEGIKHYDSLSKQNNNDIAKEHQELWDKMGYDPIHPDVLADMSQLSAAEIYDCLIEWELEGKVAGLSGGRFQKI